MRCARCGNENSGENRFCGMCGAKLLGGPDPVASVAAESVADRPSTLRSPAPSAPATRVTSQTVSPQTAAPRTSAPLAENAPVISGPSFLGLNQPEAAPGVSGTRRAGSLSIDPTSAPSSANLDYLLQDDGDDEEERGGGAGKFILILLALALAVGLGYLRWKNQGFAWLGAGASASKPSAAAQPSDATQPGSSTPSSTTSAQPDSSTPAPSASAPSISAPTTPPAAAPATTSDSTPPAASAAVPAGPPAAGPTPSPATSNPPANAEPPGATAPATSDAANSPADGTAAAPPSPAAKTPAAAADTPSPASTKPSKADVAPPAKPTPAIRPVKVDPVGEAQKYIYGRGVPQNCERGMRLLKPAADQANPKAMIEMGALYSAGLCTPHDLPTAYRWFALALRKDPDNQSVQADLSKLWGEMTQPERQLAIKLSQ